MNRWVSFRAGVVLAAAAMSVQGCQCPGKECDTSNLVVTYVAPVDGAMVEQSSNVQVSLSRSGMPVNIGTARLEIRGPGATEFGGALNGTADADKATFMNVMLAAGENALRVTVAEANCAGNAAPATIVVTAKSNVTPPPTVMACTFPQDTNNDFKLTAAELPPGTPVQLTVTTMNGTGAALSATNSNPASAPIMNETATIAVPGPTADGTFTVAGVVVTRGTQTAMCPTPPSISIARVANCTIENTTSEAPRGLADDADSATAGFQIRATATRTAGMAQTARFRLGNETRTIDLNAMANASADFTVPATGTQSYPIILEGTDSNGNPCIVTNGTRTVPVDFDPPVVTITSPTASADGGPVAVNRSSLDVTVSVTGGGQTACAFRVVGTSRTQVDCAPVTNGSAMLTVPFATDGSYGVIVEVADAAGNVGSARIDVVVTSATCGIAFTRPSSNPTLITAPQTTSGLYSFETASRAFCSGLSARLLRAPVGADGGVGAYSLLSTSVLQSQGTATFNTPVMSGDWIFRAELDNRNDAGTDWTEVSTTIDLDGPVITNPTVPTGQTQASITSASDLDPNTAGVQRILTFNARVPMGGRVDVCTTQATEIDPPMAQHQATAECGTGWYRLPPSGVVSPVSSFTFPNGTYSIKVVVISGSTTNESPPVAVSVDGVRPCLTAGSLRFPQDSNMDGKLNASELGTSPPRIQFALNPACRDVDLSTLSSTTPVLVRPVVGGVPQNAVNQLADVSFTAGLVTVNLTQGLIDETDYSFFVELTDRAGNKNVYSGAADPAAINVRYDKVLPTCTLASPTATTLNIADVPGGVLTALVTTSADVGTGGVAASLVGTSTITGTATPSGAQHQAAVALSGISGAGSWALSATCRDGSGNQANLPARTLTIDLVAPTCTFTAPVPGTTMQYGTVSITTSLNVTDADTRLVTVSSSLGGTRGALTVNGTTASGSLTYQNGTQDVSATLTDAAGNPASCSVTGVVVNSNDCGLSVSNGFLNSNGTWFNRSNTSMLSGNNGLIASLQAQTSNCSTGRAASLQRIAPTAGTAIPGTTDGSGNLSFTNVAVSDGETWRVQVINGGSSPPTNADFRVDLDAPTLTSVRIGGVVRAAASANFVVAVAGNRNVETGVAGYFADGDPASGGQVSLGVDQVQAIDFGLPGNVTVLFKSLTLATQAVTTAGQTVDFVGPTQLALPHNDSGALIVRLTDPAGNTFDWSSTMTIDVIAPDAPSVTPSFATPGVSTRKGEVTLSWAPTGDDGDAGVHAGYEVRWTTDSVLPSGNKLASAADYFGASSKAESDSAWSATNPTTRLITLPPLNTYYIAVRAKDEVGNYSAYQAPPTTGFANFWTPVTLTGPAGSAFGRSLATESSLDADNVPEIVVGAPSTNASNGSVFIYSGSANIADQSTCATGCQEITPPDTVGREFGWDVSTAGNVGDVAAENKNDLLVIQRGSASVVGRAFLYFGTTGSALSTTAGTFIMFRGDLATDRFASAGKIIKSIDGDSLDEVMINAHAANGSRGKVFVFRGKSRAGWLAAATATEPGTGAAYVPTSAADWVFDGPTDMALPSSGVVFGLERFGMGDVGDFNNDGRGDFVIPVAIDVIGRVQLYSGMQVSPDGGSFPSSPIPSTAAHTVLQGSTGTAATLSGFGVRVVGNQNVLNGTAQDLLVSRPAANSVFVFSDFSPLGVSGCAANSGVPCSASAALTLMGSSNFGTHFAVGNLNRDVGPTSLPINDLVVAEANRSWVLFQQANTFDLTVGLGTPRFNVSLFTYSSTSTFTNRPVAITDINGDSNPDLLLGDYNATNVRIWR